MSDSGDNIKVCVRLRPFIPREVGETCCVTMPTRESIVLNAKNGQQNPFVFDRCYWSHDPQGWNEYENDYYEFCTQETLHSEIGQDLITQGLEGFNSTLFAYGQTGSGKTHSVLGPLTDPGLLPRVVKGLLEEIAAKTERYKEMEGGDFAGVSKVSFVEIYNETLRDLLAPPLKPGEKEIVLNIQARPDGISVPGLTEVIVTEYGQVDDLLEMGTKNRTVQATAMNATSSRSHCIFTYKVASEEITAPGEPKKCISSWVNLVDLAGSERQKKTAAKGAVLKEGAAINKSLSTLAKVTSCLAEGKGQPPFRDSKLTLLLRDSLSGNSKTIMMAAVSPALSNIAESLSTLNFCKQVKEIKTCAVQNQEETAASSMHIQVPGGGGGKKKKLKAGVPEECTMFGSLLAVKEDDVIIEQGTEGDQMFYIIEGTCVVEIDGNEVAELTAGSTFGEQTALGMVSKRTATVRAMEDCELRVLTAANFGLAEDKIRELRARAEVADMLLQDMGAGGDGGDSGGDGKQNTAGGGDGDSDARDRARQETLKRAGLGAGQMESFNTGLECPYCTNLSDDPMLQGVLKYHFPKKVHTTFGSDPKCSVELRGLGIKPYMCSVYNYDHQKITISAASEYVPKDARMGRASAEGMPIRITIKVVEQLREMYDALADDLTINEDFNLKGEASVPVGARLLVGTGAMRGFRKREDLCEREKDIQFPAVFSFAQPPEPGVTIEKNLKGATERLRNQLRVLVDGVPLCDEVRELQHNDRIILGRSFCFLVFVPRVASGRAQKAKAEDKPKPLPPVTVINEPLHDASITQGIAAAMRKEVFYEKAPEAAVIQGAAGANKMKSSADAPKVMPSDIRLSGGSTGQPGAPKKDIYVEAVVRDGPGDHAGVKKGDVLVYINGDESEFKKHPAKEALNQSIEYPITMRFESKELKDSKYWPVHPVTRSLITGIINANGKEKPLSYASLLELEPSKESPPTLRYEECFVVLPGPSDMQESKAKDCIGEIKLPDVIDMTKFVVERTELVGCVLRFDLWHSGAKLQSGSLDLEPLGLSVPLPTPPEGWQKERWQELAVLINKEHVSSGKLEVKLINILSSRPTKPDKIKLQKVRVHFAANERLEMDKGWITTLQEAGELKGSDVPAAFDYKISNLDVMEEFLALQNPLNPEGTWKLIKVRHGLEVEESPGVDVLQDISPTTKRPCILTFKQVKCFFGDVMSNLLGPKEENVTLEMAMLEVLDHCIDEYDEIRQFVIGLSGRGGPKIAKQFVWHYSRQLQLVEEANEISAELRFEAGLRFGLEVYSEAFRMDKKPHIGVRLWQKLKGIDLWRKAAWTEGRRKLAEKRGLPTLKQPLFEQAVASYEVEDFEHRVIRMREAYEYKLHTGVIPKFDERDLDPWLPISPQVIESINNNNKNLQSEILTLTQNAEIIQKEREALDTKYHAEKTKKKQLSDKVVHARKECAEVTTAHEKVEAQLEHVYEELTQLSLDNRDAWAMLRHEKAQVAPAKAAVVQQMKLIEETKDARAEADAKCEDLLKEITKLQKEVEKKQTARRAQASVSFTKAKKKIPIEQDSFNRWNHEATDEVVMELISLGH